MKNDIDVLFSEMAEWEKDLIVTGLRKLLLDANLKEEH